MNSMYKEEWEEEQRYIQYQEYRREQYEQELYEKLHLLECIRQLFNQIGELIYDSMQNDNTFKSWLAVQTESIQLLAEKYPPKKYFLKKDAPYSNIDVNQEVTIYKYIETGEITIIAKPKELLCDEIKRVKNNEESNRIRVHINPMWLVMD